MRSYECKKKPDQNTLLRIVHGFRQKVIYSIKKGISIRTQIAMFVCFTTPEMRTPPYIIRTLSFDPMGGCVWIREVPLYITVVKCSMLVVFQIQTVQLPQATLKENEYLLKAKNQTPKNC